MADESLTITIDLDPYDYDGLWKDFTREFWQDILEDFMPDLYRAADLTRPAEQLDKELHDVIAILESGEAKTPKRYVDNLLKIYLKDGREDWVLLHIEIQGRGGESISVRMFRYHCLLFIHHKRHPAAMAILTAKRPKKEGEPGKYSAELFGTKIEYKYNVVKVYEMSDEELLTRNSLPSLFIYALKKGTQYRRSNPEKFAYMKELMRLVAKKGLDIRRRRVFMIFVERAIHLSTEEYREKAWMETQTVFHEGGNPMRYKGIIERMYEAFNAFDDGYDKGVAQGHRETASALLNFGTLTDEQIASATQLTLDDIAALRKTL